MRAPFSFGALWPVVPAADEATPAGLAPGQMPVDPARDGSVQPTAMGKRLSGALGGAAVGMASGILDAAKLPGDVYAGRVDPKSDQGIGRALDLAGTLTLGGMPMAEAGAAGIFGGKLAKGANRAALDEAQELASVGIPRRAIWDETGWFQGADRQWRFEIPDNASGYGGSGATLGEALQHPQAFDAYPDLARIGHAQPTTLADDTLGLYHGRPGGAPERIEVAQTHAGEAIPGPQRHDVALHEVQHAVQAREGTLRSADPRSAGGDYWTSPIEVEARNVERRRTWSADERRSTPPWESADVSWPQWGPEDAAGTARGLLGIGAAGAAAAALAPGDARAAPSAGTGTPMGRSFFSFAPPSVDDFGRPLDADTPGSPVAQGPAIAKRISRFIKGGPAPMEPTLAEYQQGAEFQPGQTRRPGVLPITTDAQTGEAMLAMPKWADVIGSATPSAVGSALAPVAARAGETVLGSGPIRAYHGSPHSFDRFDIRKIGTGEGFANQGHGLYFAEAPQTAQIARDTLSPVVMRDAAGLDVSAEAFAETLRAAAMRGLDGPRAERAATIADRLAASLGRTEPGPLADRLPGMRSWGRSAYGEDFPAYDRALEAAESYTPTSAGRMYEVAIDAKPSDMLPWDRGAEPYRALAERLGSPKAASDELLRQGVPGIRYADPHVPGTQNYVMFSDEPVSILRRYAVPGAVGAGGAAAALGPGDAQAASPSNPASNPGPAVPRPAGLMSAAIGDGAAPPVAPPMLTGTGGQPAPAPADFGSLAGRIVGAESGGNATARNPRSSATGAGQFIDSTWLDMVRRHRPDLAGQSREQVLALRNDPALSREMTQRYADENAAKLRAGGFEATDGNTYLAHFAGPAGARAVLGADPSTPVAAVLPTSSIAANPFLRPMSAGQLVDWAARKVGGSAPSMQMPGGSTAPGRFGLSGPSQAASAFSFVPAGGAAMTMPEAPASTGGRSDRTAEILRQLMAEAPKATLAAAPTSVPFGFSPPPARPGPSRPPAFDLDSFLTLLNRKPSR